MLTVLFLSTLLMLGGLRGAATFDLRVYSSSKDGRHSVRKQPPQQTKQEIGRSLDLKSINIHVSPTSSQISLPTIIKLYPPTAKPLHMHANMPMRFGRQSNPGDDRAPNSTPNMPQRFGRSWEIIQLCAKCPGVQDAPKLPQRLWRNSLYWNLLRTLASTQLLNTGLHWAEDFDTTTSSDEVEVQEKTFKG